MIAALSGKVASPNPTDRASDRPAPPRMAALAGRAVRSTAARRRRTSVPGGPAWTGWCRREPRSSVPPVRPCPGQLRRREVVRGAGDRRRSRPAAHAAAGPASRASAAPTATASAPTIPACPDRRSSIQPSRTRGPLASRPVRPPGVQECSPLPSLPRVTGVPSGHMVPGHEGRDPLRHPRQPARLRGGARRRRRAGPAPTRSGASATSSATAPIPTPASSWPARTRTSASPATTTSP